MSFTGSYSWGHLTGFYLAEYLAPSPQAESTDGKKESIVGLQKVYTLQKNPHLVQVYIKPGTKAYAWEQWPFLSRKEGFSANSAPVSSH